MVYEGNYTHLIFYKSIRIGYFIWFLERKIKNEKTKLFIDMYEIFFDSITWCWNYQSHFRMGYCESCYCKILKSFDTCVAEGTLSGDGPGNSSEGRLGALRNMIEASGDLINNRFIINVEDYAYLAPFI